MPFLRRAFVCLLFVGVPALGCEVYAELKARASSPHSSNVSAPDYELGKKKRALDADPLRPEEERILGRAGLRIYPSKDSYKDDAPAAQFEEWAKDLDAFLKVHRDDPAVQAIIARFLLEYANHPRGGSMPGDSVWTKPRKITKASQLYELPLYHDLEGNLLLLDGTNQPIRDGLPAKLGPDEIAASPKMIGQVTGNLKQTLGFLDLIKDGTYKGAEAVLPQVVFLRRQYLALRLIEEGQHRYDSGARSW